MLRPNINDFLIEWSNWFQTNFNSFLYQNIGGAICIRRISFEYCPSIRKNIMKYRKTMDLNYSMIFCGILTFRCSHDFNIVYSIHKIHSKNWFFSNVSSHIRNRNQLHFNCHLLTFIFFYSINLAERILILKTIHNRGFYFKTKQNSFYFYHIQIDKTYCSVFIIEKPSTERD